MQITSTTKNVALFAWGIAFATVVRALIPDTPAGRLTAAIALWAGLYPAIGGKLLSESKYWLLLAIGVPTIGALDSLFSPAPAVKIAISVGVLLAAGVALIVRRHSAILPKS